jgi:S-adenosylmethionine hydrolase
MKGVILSIAPDARLVDITHDVGSHDVAEGGFLISTAYRYFPQGTIHVVVVDPGVGSARRPVAVSSRGHVFVAPDNGVLSPILQMDSEAGAWDAYHITNTALCLDRVSHTFHGRDIFAPVAAHLAVGVPLYTVGPKITDLLVSSPNIPRWVDPNRLMANVVHVDRFGNVVTNLRLEHLGRKFVLHIGDVKVRKLVSHYDDALPGECVAIEGSTGYIEVSVRQASAAERLRLRQGDEIEVESGDSNQ